MEEKELVHLPFHPHPLTPSDISGHQCDLCGSCEASITIVEGYECMTCSKRFHKECSEFPLELSHPSHPSHPLTLFDYYHQISSVCGCCEEPIDGGLIYHCSVCKFSVDPLCAEKPQVVREVDHPKSHGHKLCRLPKPRPFTCDACGLMLDGPSLPWACLPCGVMLHKDCIDLPRVVRISRHPQHRLSYGSYPPPSDEPWPCGVCRKVVDNHYGAYSCVKGCDYVVHPKCATRFDVWDKKDLEGEPEECEDVEAPFEGIDDKVIRHFSHDHPLKMTEDYGVSSLRGNQHCQACALPIRIHSGNTIYSCSHSDCHFTLHEKCANLPRKIWYMLHAHPLKLESGGSHRTTCYSCYQEFSGFSYSCCKESCGFKVDVKCASASEPFIHITHPHPLFFASSPFHEKVCWGCKQEYNVAKMDCDECEFVLCLRCMALPTKVRYKQDRHPLVLGGGGGGGGSWWCEICEEEVDSNGGFYYACDVCCVTVHVDCILGHDRHFMPGHYREWSKEFGVEASNSCCRPLCHRCRRRCPFPVVFKQNDHHFCTFDCMEGIDDIPQPESGSGSGSGQ